MKSSSSKDLIIDNEKAMMNWVLPDTSALLRRPRLIEDLASKFDRVILCKTVISELNNIKDKKDHRAK